MIAIIQNDPQVPPGTLSALLSEAGARSSLLHPYRGEELPAPRGLSGVVVLGGAMGVHEEEAHPHLRAVRAFMELALAAQVPLLGICLGGQLLAQVAGGSVTASSPHGEKGMCQVHLTAAGKNDPLFSAIPATFTTFQWHGDSFLPPPAATLLAGSGLCPWQAFRLGCGVGVQFHPEVDRDIIATWCASSGNASSYLSSFDRERASFVSHNRAILSNFIRHTLLSGRP